VRFSRAAAARSVRRARWRREARVGGGCALERQRTGRNSAQPPLYRIFLARRTARPRGRAGINRWDGYTRRRITHKGRAAHLALTGGGELRHGPPVVMRRGQRRHTGAAGVARGGATSGGVCAYAASCMPPRRQRGKRCESSRRGLCRRGTSIGSGTSLWERSLTVRGAPGSRVVPRTSPRPMPCAGEGTSPPTIADKWHVVLPLVAAKGPFGPKRWAIRRHTHPHETTPTHATKARPRSGAMGRWNSDRHILLDHVRTWGRTTSGCEPTFGGKGTRARYTTVRAVVAEAESRKRGHPLRRCLSRVSPRAHEAHTESCIDPGPE